MRPQHSDEPPSSLSGLRYVLELGEELLCISQEGQSHENEAFKVLQSQRQLVISKVQSIFDCSAAIWFSEDLLKKFIQLQHSTESEREALSAPFITPLMEACLATLQVCGARSSDSFDADYDYQGKLYAAAAPLLVRDPAAQVRHLLGILQVERESGPPFNSDDFELLDALAQQTALAVQSGLHLMIEKRQRQQLDLVREVSKQTANLRELDEIAEHLTSLIWETFGYYYVAIFTQAAGDGELKFRASAGPNKPVEGRLEQISAPVRMGEGIIGTAALTRQELLALDIRMEQRYRPIEQLPGTYSEIALPLMMQDQLLGILDVQSDQVNGFDESDLLVLRTLAGNIAIAIANISLYQSQLQRTVQLQTVYEVSSAITSILDLEDLLSQVVKLIQERFDYPYVHLFSVHPGRRKVFYEAGSGLRSQTLKRETYTYDLDDPIGLIPWVARSGITALVNDVRIDQRYRSSGLEPSETLSELTVPLTFGGKILGVLDVQSDLINAFNEDDQFLCEALADHIAIAMRNAFLYRSEVWRREAADSLREVAGILSADVGLNQVLEAVLTELEKVLNIDAAAIWLLDETITEQQVSELSNLRLAAVHGISETKYDLEIGLQPGELLEYNLDKPAPEVLEAASSWLRLALQTDTPIIRPAGASFEPLGYLQDFGQDYSAIAAPLRIGERLLGVLSLVNAAPGRYGGEAQAMCAAFASYAAVAIENTRLYEDAHEQAWISTVLLQVSNATQSAEDLPELLDTVIRITPMLTGVKACLLYSVDEEGTFLPVAASGLDSAQRSEFERWRFAPGDVPALDSMFEDLNPVILHSEGDDERLTDILTAGRSGSEPLGFPVVVPLHARGELLGAFVVEYSSALPAMTLGKPLEDFIEERLAILRGIAHQTAIAMDNIRLLKAQKEEAYVSVALLQVAQAVVSANDLDEAIGSIVRITPILVGVKRAAVYLWDQTIQSFRGLQAYGFPRQTELQVYLPGEFPLLDAVLKENHLLAIPLEDDQRDQEPPESWKWRDPPSLEASELYLEEAGYLLLAFPLAVKGEVLGVFLVEEPDPVPNNSMRGTNSNRRLRSKRLEIITGISHQASLSIQNDILQKETVERERLEREMQLAREIQLAFLPQDTPEISGWDLRVLWLSAREVGGDFYDFFPLSGGRFGLVMADAADKGMPAALFMTLVRTLVRATAQVLDSPGEVVRRVNDLLVPDSPRGMFVTLAYGVIDIKTGFLTIANAGHNPPLIIRQPCEFERVARSGMALGVEEDIEMIERSYSLNPGDMLVMYTDGITEAFSPEGEIFGEERLLNTIRTAAACFRQSNQQDNLPASAILEAIDREVEQFIGGAARSDDLTLLVLKRSRKKK